MFIHTLYPFIYVVFLMPVNILVIKFNPFFLFDATIFSV